MARKTRRGGDNGGRSTAAYRAYRAAVINDPLEVRCVICGGWVDKSLPYRDAAGKVDPMSPSLEHTTPIVLGGAVLAGGRLAHLGCNRAQGASLRYRAEADKAALRDRSRHF